MSYSSTTDEDTNEIETDHVSLTTSRNYKSQFFCPKTNRFGQELVTEGRIKQKRVLKITEIEVPFKIFER